MQFTVIKESVTNLEEQKRSVNSPFKGRLTQVVIFFAQGCNGLVDVRVLLNNNPICPANDYIALNDKTVVFQQNQEIANGDVITAHVKNHDGTEDHDVGVYVTILPEAT